MASAGTGKTYTLINRLLRLLLQGSRAESILAITFTRKAAAEMQSRLGERLYTLASATAGELRQYLLELEITPDSSSLDRARNLYEKLRREGRIVRTTTFHAFCQEILLRFPLEADVPPGFTLLDSSTDLLRAARDNLLDEASIEANGYLAKALQQLLDFCGSLDGLERSLATFVDHRGDWWAYTEMSDKPLEFARQRLARQLRVEPASNPLEIFFNLDQQRRLAEYGELLSRHPGKQNSAAAELIATARADSEDIEKRFENCRSVFLTADNKPRIRKSSKTQAKKMGEEGEARFLQLHEEISQEILATLDQLHAHTAWQACSAWYLAGSRLLGHFQRLKQEQRQLDFTDLEWSAYRLLNRSDNAQWIQYKLDQRIDHLLVDEFQDTNPTQWRLLLPILEELAATESEKPRSVFLVGDAKQSIYRFRRAEPRLFTTAQEWLTKHLAGQSFPLHTSWRSSPAIMDCVNRVFDDEGPLGGALYDFTKHNTHHKKLWGEVKILPLIERPVEEKGVIEATLRNPLQQPREQRTNQQYLLEGEQITGEILRLITTHTPIMVNDEVRPVRYGDIMILVRKRTHTSFYEQALRSAGIPYLGAERGTLLQSGEVGDMVALLEVLLTPDNNLSLATVLRSPLFACSDDDLMRLAQFDHASWYQRLLALAPQISADEPLAQAACMLQAWHQLAGRIPVHDLLDRVYCESDLLRRYRASYPPHLGDRVLANLGRFLELALEIDSGRYPSLGHFLSRLGEISANNDDAPDQVTGCGDRNRVRLLTIHAAKGLEAPVVFLADSTQSENVVKPFHTLLEWPAEASRPESFFLVGKKDQQPAALRQRLQREQQEQRREAANLLYVAMTRARQLLFVSGARATGKDENGWYFALRSALDPTGTKSMDEPCILSSGVIPTTGKKDEPASVTTSITIDPKLSQALQIDNKLHEIAPSYQGSTSGLPSMEGSEKGRLRGLLIHRLLQLMSDAPARLAPQAILTLASEFNLEKDDVLLQQCYEECSAIINDAALGVIFQPENNIQALNEVPVIYQLDGKTVHGIIDRLLLGPSNVWIIDYKSHLHATTNNAEELATTYRQQLGYYATGIHKLWPKHRVRGFLLFTKPRLLMELELNTPV